MGVVGTKQRIFFRTAAEFATIAAAYKVDGALYYIYDRGALYQYSAVLDTFVNYAGSMDIYETRPTTPIDGKLYVIGTAGNYKLEFYQNGAWETIGGGLTLGETAATAYRGDRGKIAYDHSQATGNPHGTTFAQLGSKPTTLAGYGITDALAVSLKGAPNGLAELDSGGKVPSSQLPSYVDDVLEYATLANFPATGESGKIYVAQNTNLSYRWSGTAYAEISPSLALGETSATAYRGDRGKTAYDHSQATGNPHGTTLANMGESYASINYWTKSGSQLAYTDGPVQTNYLNQTVTAILVGGNANTYYPTKWRATDGGAKARKLRLFRNSTNYDASYHGAYSCEITYHPTVWGNFGSNNLEVAHSYYTQAPFVAAIADGSTANGTPEMIVWLRGASTHQYEYISTNGSWYCVDANSAGGPMVDVSGVTHNPTTAVAEALINCFYSPVIRSLAFAKIGGTASQFLKADGTVDSNAYLTSESDTLASVTGRGNSTSTQVLLRGGFLIDVNGTSGMVPGTGDGSTYTTYNIKLSGWNGMAIENPTSGGAYPNQIVGLLDFRNGTISLKGGYKVNGGTAAQFLKADGSRDGNTYLTGITKAQVEAVLTGTITSHSHKNVLTAGTGSSITPSGNYAENEYHVTALAANLTINAPSGTAANGNTLVIKLVGTSSAYTLTWNAIYRAVGVSVPTAIGIGKTLYIGAIYNATATKWDIVGFKSL